MMGFSTRVQVSKDIFFLGLLQKPVYVLESGKAPICHMKPLLGLCREQDEA